MLANRLSLVIPVVVLAFLCALAVPGASLAQTTPEELEAAGLPDPPVEVLDPRPVGGKQTTQVVNLLLIPDSTADRIMAFDPVTGNLINADFIPADATNLSTPKNALLRTGGAEILVADQIRDAVQRYSAATGAFLGTFAPAGGADTSILNNVTGAAYRASGNLVVCSQDPSNADAVAEFDTTGAYVSNFIATNLGGLDGPFDVYFRTGDVLVSSINTDQVLRYDLSGSFLGVFASVNNFPQQIAEASNGNVLVANFGGTQEGIVEFTSAGVLVGVYDPASLGGYRGVYELPNGNLLVTNGGGVHEIDRSGNLVQTKISGVSGQYIELAVGVIPVELTDFSVE